jgi:hypothetical protein
VNRLPSADDLTGPEFTALCRVATGFSSRTTISAAHQMRLIDLELIQLRMGGLMATPAGRMVARAR